MQLPITSPVSALSADAGMIREIKEGAFRVLMIATSIMLLAWYFLANFIPALGDIVHVSMVTLVAEGFAGVAFLLMRRSLSAARVAWLGGNCLALILALFLFQRADLLYFFILLPLMAAVVTFHWKWGLLTELGLAVLLLFLEPAAGLRQAAPTWLTQADWMILLIAGIALIIGGTLAQTMLSLASWSMANYRQARQELEQIRDERVRLLQIQDDFVLANKELARLTDRLAAMTQVAEEARRIKEEFVARVSHELRTPLNMVIGFSEVIMKSPQLYGDSIPSALLADVDAIMRNSQHLARLVDDILDLSQVEAGRMALTKEWTALPEIITEAISAVKGLFDSKGLYLRDDLPENLPAVFCDCTRIRQVVINLLGNAARFTEQGGVEVRIQKAGNQVVISVADSGPGIALADQKQVFEPFYQVDTALRRHKGGTGLGLTISKQFVEMHGGKMWLTSEPGNGTTFCFSLPVQLDRVDIEEGLERWFNPYSEYEPRNHLANLPTPKPNPRYVVVENENSLQRLFTRYADNVEVIGVRRIEEAVSEVRRSPARALILNTPENLDEPALKAQLGDLPFGTPVISCWLPGREEAARRLGVVEYLVKPVSRQDVLSALGKVTGARRVLLVDDEPEILRLFVRLLSSTEQSYTIIQAMNGHRALQLLRSRKPDVMLLDLVMPEMDGYQVLHEKSQDPATRDIPVIVVSSLNPRGESDVSRVLSVTRENGLSARELLSCVQSITKTLLPDERSVAAAGKEKGG